MTLDPSMFQRFSVDYDKGAMIFSEFEPGDTFYLIQTGRVQIVRVIGDIEKAIDILQPGEIFGEMAILEEAPRSATAIAIEPVTLLEFNRANFEILMQGNPQIALRLLKQFTKRIYEQKRRFMILTLNDVEARVADVFLMLTESNPDAGDRDRVEFETTADGVAHWAGMSPVAVKEVINHFVTQKRIELFPNKIVVKNIHDFERFVTSRRKGQDRA